MGSNGMLRPPPPKRGFCATCGSTLFWQGKGRDYIAIAAGTLDGDSGLRIEGHIFCADKGDYYQISGGDYQVAQRLSGTPGLLSVPAGD